MSGFEKIFDKTAAESLKKQYELHKLLKTPQEEILESGEKTSDKVLGGGVNVSRFVEIKGDGSVIFKPAKGESRNLRDYMEAGTYYKRERAAYLVSRFLGIGRVPPTVIREVDGETGSAQEFIPDVKTGGECDYDELFSEYRDELKILLFFDFIIWNTDRHMDNLIVKDNKVYAIDHGLAFGKDWHRFFDSPKLWEDASVPRDVAQKLEEFESREEDKGILEDLLLELLPADEVRACFNRIKRLCRIAKRGRISQADISHLTNAYYEDA